MNLKGELQAFGQRFDIEEAHVAHVADLAISLFDGFSAGHGIQKEDRAVLQAAAYLHDIGYSTDPENHVDAGLRILLENPLASFSTKEWAMVAGIILLHRRDWRKELEHELFEGMGAGRKERIRILAALLRVADGLDHGRLQDVRIAGCRRGKKNDRIGVVCGWYAGNIPWAESKADLWEAVFKRHLRIEGSVKQSRQCFKRVVRPEDTAVVAFRRILHSQYDVMRDRIPAMQSDGVVDGLHDYRVALRRFRAALKLLLPLLEDKDGVRKLDKRLGRLSDQLGPIRDAHVVWTLVQDAGLADEADAGYVGTVEDDFATANQMLAEMVAAAPFRRVNKDVERFLRAKLPAFEQTAGSKGFGKYIGGRVDELLQGIAGAGPLSTEAGSAQLHELRKLCRRARYYAEFAAPACGKSTGKKARQLSMVASALGDIRDAESLLERLEEAGCAVGVLERLAGRRQDAWKRFEQGWSKLTG